MQVMENAQLVLDNIISWIQDFFKKTGGKRAVVGISGGKDSSVVAAMCVKALGKENVIGVLMPNGTQSDIEDSKRLCAHIGIEPYVVNIKAAYDGILSALPSDLQITPQFKTNTPSRLRMVTLYSIAACLDGARVANTGNYDEGFVGYTTIYGDCAGDFAPLRCLHVSEVVALGDLLGLPYDLTHKAPSDGMCGKTDEDNLGFTYHDVEVFSQTGDAPDAAQILAKHNANKFKSTLINPPSPYERIATYLTKRS